MVGLGGSRRTFSPQVSEPSEVRACEVGLPRHRFRSKDLYPLSAAGLSGYLHIWCALTAGRALSCRMC